MWIGVIVVVVLVLLGWYWYAGMGNGAQNAGTPSATNTTNGTTGAQSLPSDSSSSDASLSQDTAAVGTQMSGLDSDSASMNQSFNDQPVSQSY